LITILKEWDNYFNEVDALTNFILKLIGRNENARKWFLSNKEKWSWLIGWIETNPTPPNLMSSGPVFVIKFL
jgi:hypothetical protein